MNSEVYETALSYIQLIEGRIVRVELKKDQTIDRDKMLENLAVYKKILDGKKGLFISIVDPYSVPEDGLRSIYEAKQRIEIKEAEAFVVPNLSSRIEVEYLTVEVQKHYPRKLFKTKEEGMLWLRSFID